jgi:hypothetical protein
LVRQAAFARAATRMIEQRMWKLTRIVDELHKTRCSGWFKFD